MSYESTNQLLTEFLGKDVFKYVVNEYLMISKEEVRCNHDRLMHHLKLFHQYDLDIPDDILDILVNVNINLDKQIRRLSRMKVNRNNIFESDDLQDELDKVQEVCDEYRYEFEHSNVMSIFSDTMPDDLRSHSEAKAMARKYLRQYDLVYFYYGM
jgi:hypothetical protein